MKKAAVTKGADAEKVKKHKKEEKKPLKMTVLSLANFIILRFITLNLNNQVFWAQKAFCMKCQQPTLLYIDQNIRI